MSTFAVVDLSNLFARARFVTKGDSYSKAGMATMIVFKSLRKIYREFSADHVVFAVDGGSWRYDVYPLYKARRKAAKQELKTSEREEAEIFYEALTNLTDYLDAKTNCTVLREKGMEADDLVARWIQNHPDDQHVIVSGDSDFVQLLTKNVRIYDGINDRLISTDGVTNDKGEKLEFNIDSGSGKIKVGNVPKVNPAFVPDSDWWKFALFVKIIRGDSGDGIMGAYPGISFKGTTKRVGIIQAWEDRFEKGYHWQNFFLSTWKRPIGTDVDGNISYENVVVRDEYNINQSLIDLTMQPDGVKEKMDQIITKAANKPRVKNIGFHFVKFTAAHNQPLLDKESSYHLPYLSAAYPTKE